MATLTEVVESCDYFRRKELLAHNSKSFSWSRQQRRGSVVEAARISCWSNRLPLNQLNNLDDRVYTMSNLSNPHDAATVATAATCSASNAAIHKAPSAQRRAHHNCHHHQHESRHHHKQPHLFKSKQTGLASASNRKSPLAATESSRRHQAKPSLPPSLTLDQLQINQIRVPCRPYLNLLAFSMMPLLIVLIISLNLFTTLTLSQESSHYQTTPSRYRLSSSSPSAPYGRPQAPPPLQLQQQTTGNPAIVPQVWARGLVPEYQDESLRDNSQNDQSLALIVRRNSNTNKVTNINNNNNNNNNNMMKSVRHIVTGPNSNSGSTLKSNTTTTTTADDICLDRLCYGLPMGCLGGGGGGGSGSSMQPASHAEQSGSLCSVLVTSKRFIDPNRPISRDILFELIALPVPDISNYAAVGFSETGRMQGLVSECLQYRDAKTQLQIIKLKHSYNTPGMYTNVPVTILSGIKNLGVSYENGYYQCRWIVESAVEFSYEATNGSIINRREDLGYKNYHILLASGEYNEINDVKNIHMDRISSMAPVSLAQTGHIKSLGSHILIRIHGSLMIAIWVGLVTLSIVLARYYKNEWSNSKISDLAIWFVVHRTLMLTSWFGSIIAVIFAYMYTETYHPGLHQISGTTCLVLSTIQILGGLFRPSQESSKRIYFNWTHFICGNFSYLFAMICLITAAFLAPAHLPPLYIWVMVIFVGTYALMHTMMTIHQYIVHKSSKISITPMSDLNSNSSSTYTSCGFVADSYPKEVNSPFRQFMLGILVTIIVIFIVLLISLVNIK